MEQSKPELLDIVAKASCNLHASRLFPVEDISGLAAPPKKTKAPRHQSSSFPAFLSSQADHPLSFGRALAPRPISLALASLEARMVPCPIVCCRVFSGFGQHCSAKLSKSCNLCWPEDLHACFPETAAPPIPKRT